MEWLDFLTVIILAFAIVMILAGIFTTWYGNGKSRIAGILMLIAGIVVGAVWIVLCQQDIIHVDILNVFLEALINLVGVLIGAIVAIAIFLIAILKS